MDDSLDERSPCTRSPSVTRRRLLRAGGGITAVSMTGFAGCVGDSQSPENSEEFDDYPPPDEFEKCEMATAIYIGALPNPAQTEVETTLEDGQYETDGELYLPHLMDIDTSYLISGGWSYGTEDDGYRAVVNQDGATTTLELEEAVPSHGEEPLEVRNSTYEQLIIQIHVKQSRTDETVVDETVTVDPDSNASVATFDRQFGEYQLTVTTDSEEETVASPGSSWTEKNDKPPMDIIGVSYADSVDPKPESESEPEPEPVARIHIHPWECAEWAE